MLLRRCETLLMNNGSWRGFPARSRSIDWEMFKLTYNGASKASIAVTAAVATTTLRLGAERYTRTSCKTPDMI